MIDAYTISHLGGRTSQQDACCVLHDTDGHQAGLGVFDGAGAMADGAAASSIAKTTTQERIGGAALGHWDPAILQLVCDTLIKAQQRVASDERMQGPTPSATTAVVVLVVEGFAVVAWVGDSKAWLWRDGQLTPISRSHALSTEAWCGYEIRHHEIDSHPNGHVITRAINSGSAPSQPDLRVLPVLHGDRLIVASDGLDAVLNDDAIQKRLSRHTTTSTAQAIADDLLNTALDRRTPDNVSVGVIRILDPHRYAPEMPTRPGVLGAIYDNLHLQLEQPDA